MGLGNSVVFHIPTIIIHVPKRLIFEVLGQYIMKKEKLQCFWPDNKPLLGDNKGISELIIAPGLKYGQQETPEFLIPLSV